MLDASEREHVDGIGDGLSIAVGIVRSSKTLTEANNRITAALVRAREAKDRDNLAKLRELTAAVADPT